MKATKLKPPSLIYYKPIEKKLKEEAQFIGLDDFCVATTDDEKYDSQQFINNKQIVERLGDIHELIGSSTTESLPRSDPIPPVNRINTEIHDATTKEPLSSSPNEKIAMLDSQHIISFQSPTEKSLFVPKRTPPKEQKPRSFGTIDFYTLHSYQLQVHLSVHLIDQ